MHYGEIKNYDIANGPGVRVSLFVSGCRNACENCFQPETWDFRYGSEFTAESAEEIYEALRKEYISGLTVLGGEPLEPENQKDLLPFLKDVRKRFPQKTIWLYSGFTLEELEGNGSRAACGKTTYDILSLIDVLVDGRFIEEEKDITLRFRGSANQRLIDMKRTRDEGTVVLWDGDRG